MLLSCNMIPNANIVLVLTGTITPFIHFKVVAKDPHSRLEEYVKSVTWYLKNTPYKVVFCENSGFTNFMQYIIPNFDHCELDKRFEYLTFVSKDYGGGAGAGECDILRRVQKESRLIRNASIIVKCTGRLILTNLTTVMRQLKKSNHSFFAGDYAIDFRSMTTTFFAFTPDLYDALLTIQPLINKDNYIELAIMHFVHSQIRKDPSSVLFFNHPLLISGRSGHYGTVYDTPLWKIPLRYLYRLIRILKWHQIKKIYQKSNDYSQ